jgi:arylsulfatase A-like enzyme
MGNKDIKTPNLDALSKESAVFDNFVVTPACSPTRANLMTGHNHLLAGVWGVGVRNNLMRDETLMPQYFKAGGYNTDYFGKRDGVFILEKKAWDWEFDEASLVTGYNHKDPILMTEKVNKKRIGWTCGVDLDNTLDYIKRQGNKPWMFATAFILPHLPWTPDKRFTNRTGKLDFLIY